MLILDSYNFKHNEVPQTRLDRGISSIGISKKIKMVPDGHLGGKLHDYSLTGFFKN